MAGGYNSGTDAVGMADLRAEHVDKAVKGFALAQYKFKPLCLVQSTNAWKNTYYKETAAVLTASNTNYGVANVARLAAFPDLEETWEETSARILKFAGKGIISVEDVKTNAIDVMARSLFRITEAITSAVDSAIYSAWIADADINTGAAAVNWNDATPANRVPIDDILAGVQAIAEDNYDVLENGYLLLNPNDYRYLLTNSKVINNPSFKTADVVSNGKVGQICGLNIIVSNNVPADEALILKGQTAATWKSLAGGLHSNVVLTAGIKYEISAWEWGITQVTNPQAIYRITGTSV